MSKDHGGQHGFVIPGSSGFYSSTSRNSTKGQPKIFTGSGKKTERRKFVRKNFSSEKGRRFDQFLDANGFVRLTEMSKKDNQSEEKSSFEPKAATRFELFFATHSRDSIRSASRETPTSFLLWRDKICSKSNVRKAKWVSYSEPFIIQKSLKEKLDSCRVKLAVVEKTRKRKKRAFLSKTFLLATWY